MGQNFYICLWSGPRWLTLPLPLTVSLTVKCSFLCLLLGIHCLCLCHSICCSLCLCNCLCHHRRAGGRGCQRVAAAGWGPFVRLNHGALLRHGHRHRRRPWRAALAMASCFSLPCGPRHHHHRRHKDPCRLHPQSRHQTPLWEDVPQRVLLRISSPTHPPASHLAQRGQGQHRSS